ncbi:MAG: bifunctional diaminohydroxyphosphoribosylaminopyrimidine deaminase/5-amino-6-(5-phosphoribosylamino)uracil reductase RibD [Verrucomicrobiota bacterium]
MTASKINSSNALDRRHLQTALRLARRAYGQTAPNPMVGAVLVNGGQIIGRGWHHQAGQPHAEIEALRDAAKRGRDPRGATLYITLEPCCTQGRTPPCTTAIIEAGIRRVVVAATDPNPQHAGRGFALLEKAGVQVQHGELATEAELLNEAFNHWIVHRTPWITVKAAMTLDGKIATASGESKWITGEAARAEGMNLRLGADAILTGINTILADDPSLTLRLPDGVTKARPLRRIILDSRARTPLAARVITDACAAQTTLVTTAAAPATRRKALARHCQVWVAPTRNGRVDLRWLLRRLGKEEITNLLVEGGGEVNAAFLLNSLAHRVAFFYAPKVLGGRNSKPAVAGLGARSLKETLRLRDLVWRQLGEDLFLTARIAR